MSTDLCDIGIPVTGASSAAGTLVLMGGVGNREQLLSGGRLCSSTWP